jgi:DNA polymerase III sliding clamp (beta) subunit (PCNA family)
MVIPKGSDATVKIKRGPALRAVRAVLVAAAQDTDHCPTSLHFGPDRLIVEAKGERGDAVEAVDIERTEGKPGSIKVNGRFLADVLDAAPEEVEVGMSGRLDPLLFRAAGLVAVIMPMRAEWDRSGYHWKGEE